MLLNIEIVLKSLLPISQNSTFNATIIALKIVPENKQKNTKREFQIKDIIERWIGNTLYSNRNVTIEPKKVFISKLKVFITIASILP